MNRLITTFSSRVFERKLALWAIMGLALFLGVSATRSKAIGLDFQIWVFVHEWLSRGGVLYEEVYDHKDPGFFWINSVFYRTLGESGLFLSGFLASLMIGLAAFLTLRQFSSTHRSLLLASATYATYVCSPTFLSTYTENFAAAFAVLAVSIVRRRPIVAGLLLAVSISVKFSGVVIFLAIMISLLAVEAWENRGGGQSITDYVGFKLLVSFSTLILAGALMAHLGDWLDDWLDVLQFNVQYSSYRGRSRPNSLNFRDWISFVGIDLWIAGYLGLFVFALSATRFTTRGSRTIINRRKPGFHGIKVSPLNQERLLAISVLLGASVALVGQMPANSHHYGYLVAPLCYTTAIELGVIIEGRTTRRRYGRLVCLLISFTLIVSGFLLVARRDGGLWVLDNSKRWWSHSSSNPAEVDFSNIGTSRKIIFVNFLGDSINVRYLPKQTRLGCRFFYHFSHMLPRYSAEMIQCVLDGADFIVIGMDKQLDSGFQTHVDYATRQIYTICSANNNSIKVLARKPHDCRRLR